MCAMESDAMLGAGAVVLWCCGAVAVAVVLVLLLLLLLFVWLW